MWQLKEKWYVLSPTGSISKWRRGQSVPPQMLLVVPLLHLPEASLVSPVAGGSTSSLQKGSPSHCTYGMNTALAFLLLNGQLVIYFLQDPMKAKNCLGAPFRAKNKYFLPPLLHSCSLACHSDTSSHQKDSHCLFQASQGPISYWFSAAGAKFRVVLSKSELGWGTLQSYRLAGATWTSNLLCRRNTRGKKAWRDMYFG